MECCNTESQRQSLTDEDAQDKQRALRAVVVKKSLAYFKDKRNRSVTEGCLLTRRKNLAAHFGLDMSVDKNDMDQINLATLPFPLSAKQCATRLVNQTTFGSTEQGVHEDLESDEQVGYSQILHDIAEKDLEMPIQSTFTDQIHSPSSSSGHTESSSSCSCSSCSCDENCPPDCKGEFVCCFKGSCNLDVVPLENCKNGLICCDKKSCQSQVVEVTECPNQMESNRKSIDVGSAPIKSSNDDNEGDVHFANQSTQTLQCSKDGPCHEESIFDVENDEKQAFDFKRRRSVGFQIPRFNSTGNLLQPSLYEKDSYYTGKDLSAYLGMKDQVSKSIQFHELFADEREMYRSSVKSAITRTRSSFKKLKRKLSFKSSGSRREIFNPPSKTKSPYLKRGPAVRRPAKKHPSLTRNPTTYF